MANIWNGQYREPEYWSYFGQRLAELSIVHSWDNILDIGTGLGDVLLPAAKMTDQRIYLVGIDKNYDCVEKTAAYIKDKNVIHASVARMDARNLGFKSDLFDVTLSGFVGWDDVFDFGHNKYLEADDKKTREMKRVLKPGGNIGISSWIFQQDSEWMGQLIGSFQKSNQDMINPLCYSKETPEGWSIILAEAGFTNVEMIIEQKEFTYLSEAEWLSVMQHSGWKPYLDRITRGGPEQIDQFEYEVFGLLAPYKQPDGIHYIREVLYILAMK